MNVTLVSDFAHLRNWNPELLMKKFKTKAANRITTLFRSNYSGRNALGLISIDALVDKLDRTIQKEAKNEFSTVSKKRDY